MTPEEQAELARLIDERDTKIRELIVIGDRILELLRITSGAA